MSDILRASRLFLSSVKATLFATLTVCVLAIGLPGTGFAQSATTGAVIGTVTDSNGALLPGVTVTITSIDTGVSRVVKSNRSGEYTVDALDPGSYTALYVEDGFESYEEKAVVVTVGSASTVSPI